MKTSSGSKPEIVGSKIVDQTADTLGLQINISIGFGSKNERWYSNIVFSILIGAGTAIAWRRRGLFLSSQQLSASSHLCSVQANAYLIVMQLNPTPFIVRLACPRHLRRSGITTVM